MFSKFNKKIEFDQIFPLILVILLIIGLVSFVFESINIAASINKNTFTYMVKARGTLEEIDKIFERAEVNVNVLSDTISNTYDINRQRDKGYNFRYIKQINGLVKAVLANAPGVDGAWFQLNADLPYSASAYNWYEFRDNQVFNLNEQFEDGPDNNRPITKENDPYYFEAIENQKTTWSELYTDADTKSTMITVSRPVYEDGVLIGVAGIDISTDNMQQALLNMQAVFYDSDLFLLNDKNDVMLSQLLDNSNSDLENSKVLKLIKNNQCNDGIVEYFENGKKKTAIMLALSNKYNIAITFTDSDIFEGVNQLFNTIYFILIISLALILVTLANKYAKKKTAPIIENTANESETENDSDTHS